MALRDAAVNVAWRALAGRLDADVDERADNGGVDYGAAVDLEVALLKAGRGRLEVCAAAAALASDGNKRGP